MNFYVTGGSLQSNAPSYVEREADRQLLKGLLEGEFCYVLTARQMGKSSLMVRTANRLRAGGIHIIAMDLTAIGGQNVTADQWYHGLLDMLGQALDLEDKLERFWDANSQLGPLHRLMKAIRQVVLSAYEAECGENLGPRASAGASHLSGQADGAHSQVRLVIFVDEIDFVRSLPFHTDEFFAAIRECYNRRTLDSAYRRLTFCLLGVASPPDLIRDTRTTPFNIGRRIELNDFTPEEAAPLALGLQHAQRENSLLAAERSAAFLGRILYWTEGHPYLTQKLCRVIAEALEGDTKTPQNNRPAPSAIVDQVCCDLFFGHRAREHDDNLIFVRERLLRDETDPSGLLELYLKVWQGKRVMDDELDPLITQLRLSGVVRIRNGRLRERNRIYGRVFASPWVRANMPQAELRRQRDAYRKVVVWVATVSSLIIVALISLSLVAMAKTAESNLNQAKAWRSSGRLGQRVNALDAIRKARRWGTLFGTRQELIDEAVAALNLVDLRKFPDDPASEADVLELNDTFLRHAVGHKDGSIQVFDRKTKKLALALPGLGLPVQWMRFDPDDRFLAAAYGGEGSEETRCVVWNLENRSKVLDFKEPVLKEAVDFSRSGHRLAVGFNQQRIRVYDLIGRTELFESPKDPVRTEGYPVVCVRFDPAGRYVAESSTGSLYVNIWDIATEVPKPYQRYPHPAEVVHLDWAPQGAQLATACENGDIYLFRHFPDDTKERLYRAGVHVASPRLRFNRSGSLLAVTCSDLGLRLWRPWNERELLVAFDLDNPNDPRFSNDDRQFCVATASGRLRLFNMEGGPELITIGRSSDNQVFQSVGFDPSGRVLMAAGPGESLWFGDIRDPQSQLRTDLHALISNAAFDPRGGRVFAAGASGFYELPLDLIHHSDGDQLHIGSAHRVGFQVGLGPFALATNGTAAVIRRGRNDQIEVFTLRSLEKPSIRNGNTEVNSNTELDNLAITLDGKWLFASPRTEQELLVWNVSETNVQRVCRIPQARHPAVSPSGNWIITRCPGEFQFREIGSWSLSTLRIPRSSTSDQYSPVAFGSLPGKGEYLVAAATSPSVIELYRFHDRSPPRLDRLSRLENPTSFAITCLVLDATGGRLAALTDTQIVQVWNLAQIRKELDALGLAKGFPELSEAPSSKHLQFVVDASDGSEEEKTVREIRGEILTRITKLTDDLKASELTGSALLEELGKFARDRQDPPRYDLALADLKRALQLRPNDERIKKLKAAFEQLVQLPSEPPGRPLPQHP
jgi:WD40 repeat protein